MQKKDRALLGTSLISLFIISVVGMIFSEKIGPTWTSFSSSIGAGCITSFVFLLISNRRDAKKEELQQAQLMCDKLTTQYLRFLEVNEKIAQRNSVEENVKIVNEIIYYSISWFAIYDDLISYCESMKEFLTKSNCLDGDGYTSARRAIADLDTPAVEDKYEYAKIIEIIKPISWFLCIITVHTMEWTQIVQGKAWGERKKIF